MALGLLLAAHTNKVNDASYNTCLLGKRKSIKTFVSDSETFFEESYERFSSARSNRSPSELHNIFIPPSLVETAKSVPSLLKRIRGLA